MVYWRHPGEGGCFYAAENQNEDLAVLRRGCGGARPHLHGLFLDFPGAFRHLVRPFFHFLFCSGFCRDNRTAVHARHDRPGDHRHSNDCAGDTDAGCHECPADACPHDEGTGPVFARRYIQPAGASWNLLLVNAWNPMEKAYYQETHQNHIVSFKTGGQIDDRVSKALEEMLEAAKETGLRAGYLFRTPERSAANLENKTQYYINKGYSREAARKKALETIAAPYTSEHNLGLAIDMTQKGDGSLRTTFEQTAAFAWLQEHCAEYGFILRYPKGKQDITGVSYEPWHYRYVGREHAEEIMRRGLTLEEYLQEKGL